MRRGRFPLYGILLAAVVIVALIAWRFSQPAARLYQGIAPLLSSPPPLPQRSPVPDGEGGSLPLTLPDFLQAYFFAQDLSSPRDLTFSPGGTLLASLPGSGQVVALPDKDGDGRVDLTQLVADKMNNPHGIAFSDGKLFVAEETRLSRWIWDENTLTARFDKKLVDLPKGGRHTTRSVVITANGSVYVTLGSTCDTCFERHPWIGTVIVTDREGTEPRVFSQGLRNSVFLTLKPDTDEVWATEMGRDFLGDDLPPDEINRLRDGHHYGWPVCYGNRVWDKQFGQYNEEFCDGTETPMYQIPAHSAPLGLTFIQSTLFPQDWQGDLLVAYHGSWNRSIPTGYKVVRVDLETQTEQDVVTGWFTDGKVWGRPADVEFGPDGSLYISDDRAGAVYRVTDR